MSIASSPQTSPTRPRSHPLLSVSNEGHSRPSTSSPQPLRLCPLPQHHLGCVLCGIVASSFSSSSANPTNPINLRHLGPEASSSGENPPGSSVDDTPIAETSPMAHSPQSPVSATYANGPMMNIPLNGNGGRGLGREILYHDESITVFPARGKETLCKDGRHLIIVVNRHLESIYELVSGFRLSTTDNSRCSRNLDVGSILD